MYNTWTHLQQNTHSQTSPTHEEAITRQHTATLYLTHMPQDKTVVPPTRPPHTSKCPVLPHSGPAPCARARAHTHPSPPSSISHSVPHLPNWHLLGLRQRSGVGKAQPCPSRVQTARAPPQMGGYPAAGGFGRPSSTPKGAGGAAPGLYLRLPRRGAGWEARGGRR